MTVQSYGEKREGIFWSRERLFYDYLFILEVSSKEDCENAQWINHTANFYK